MTRIFAPCGFTHKNKGDALLLRSLHRALIERFGSTSEVTFSSFSPKRDSAYYGALVGPQPLVRLLQVHGRFPRRLSALLFPIAFLSTVMFIGFTRLVPARVLRHAPLPRRWRFPLQSAGDADLVVAVPGGYLMAACRLDWAWMSHACVLAACTATGTPTILSPCSIGPFAFGHRWIARAVLSKIDRIVLREPDSAAHLRALGIPMARVEVAADMAFAMPQCTSAHRVEDGPAIGISVRRHGFPGSKNAPALWSRYLDSMAAVADWAQAELGARIVFVPQCTGGGGDDPAVSVEVVERCRLTENITVLATELDIEQLCELYASFDLLVGTRMHANLIAMTQGTPVVAVAYEHKTQGIMRQLGLAEFVVDIADVDPVSLRVLVARAWDCHEALRDRLDHVILPAARSRAISWLEDRVFSSRAFVMRPHEPAAHDDQGKISVD